MCQCSVRTYLHWLVRSVRSAGDSGLKWVERGKALAADRAGQAEERQGWGQGCLLFIEEGKILKKQDKCSM